MLMRRGQVTLEFIIILAITMTIFLVTVNAVMKERRWSVYAMVAIDAQDRVQQMAQAINGVYLGGPGTNRNITLPKKLIGGVNYTITIRPRLVGIQTYPANYTDFEAKFLTGSVLVPAEGETFTPGLFTVTNINGSINISVY